MSNPKPLTPQQLARLRAFIYSEPIMTHQEFAAKWDVSRELIAQLAHVDVRTVNTWFSQGRTHTEPQLYHKWYLTMADIILGQYEYLPQFLQTLLSHIDNNF